MQDSQSDGIHASPHGVAHRGGNARRDGVADVGCFAGRRAATRDAEEPGDDQYRRRRRRPRAYSGRHRGLPEEAPPNGVQDQLHQSACARAPREAQGHAGRGSQRHRHGADRHRLSRRRHRAGRIDQAPPGIRGEIPESREQLSACRCENAGAGAGLRHHRGFHAGGTAARIQPREGQAGSDHSAGAARLVQGQPESADLRAPR